MAFHVLNTLSRQLEKFEPIESGKVGMYTCGPTVYNYAHIGNFRAYVFEDLLRRYLSFCGYDVTQVMNLTDVDDKTIKGSIAEGVALNDYTKTYKEAFFSDLKLLNIVPAERYPAATDHIGEMIRLIRILMEKGVAYQSEDGSVYFSISRYEPYGKLAHLDKEGLRAGARVAQDEYDKENLADFALWKAWDERDGDVVWNSPWGRGRPGWHIECSAMAMKYLGPSLDIHTGGVDNIFPHHEDEMAQSEAATGQPFSRYWMHCAHLVVDGKKMSKSLGNFYTLRDIIEKGYTGREIRYVLISTHYRQSLNFSFDALHAARAALRRLDEFQARLQNISRESVETLTADFIVKCRENFVAGLDDDLNISKALAAVFELVHEGNRRMDEDALTAEDAGEIQNLLQQFDDVLGFVISDVEETADASVWKLVEARRQARKDKDWAEADRVRDAILAKGWIVKDTPDGPKVQRK